MRYRNNQDFSSPFVGVLDMFSGVSEHLLCFIIKLFFEILASKITQSMKNLNKIKSKRVIHVLGVLYEVKTRKAYVKTTPVLPSVSELVLTTENRMSEVTKFGTQALYRKLSSKSEFLESRFSDSRTLTDFGDMRYRSSRNAAEKV
jgi:hypothetical protein